MSTNEELIREAVNRLKGWASSKSIAEHHASAIRTVLDALEQTTRELEEARLELDATETKATGYRQNNTRMADTLAKVREYLHGHRAVLDAHTKFELGSILDESASRPAPTEPSDECWEKHGCDGTACDFMHPDTAAPAPIEVDGWVTSPDGEQFRPGECQGHAECPAAVHIEGCFATARDAAPIEAGERECPQPCEHLSAEDAREGKTCPEHPCTCEAGEREALIEQATWALIEYDTDTADRGVSDEHYRERRADVELIAPILAARRAPIEDTEPPEADATPDEAYELGRVAGYDEAMREVTGNAEPVAYEVRDRKTGNLIRVSRPTDFWPIKEAWAEKYECDLIPLYRHPAAPTEPSEDLDWFPRGEEPIVPRPAPIEDAGTGFGVIRSRPGGPSKASTLDFAPPYDR